MDVKVFPANWGGIAPKPCDSCKSSTAHLFCRHHSAFLCMSCDSKIHNKLASHSHHERVIMCEVCEQAPAAVRCKADAAALCVTCDSDIHSANPLARRHDRVPIEPFYDSSDRAVNFLVPTNDEAEAASWILPVPSVVAKQVDRVIDAKIEEVVGGGGGGDMFFSDFDHLLEFDVVDSVVPVQQIASHNHNYREIETCFEIDFCKSKLTPFNYDSANTISNQSQLIRSNYDSANAISYQSKNISSSSSSLDVGVVPDGGGVMNIGGGGSGGVDQLTGMDREARVLRYREKRKNRKFEKTIRYASRKAYAETRPRIKGRFAKRTETCLETDPDQFLFNPIGSVDFMCDAGYGVVPSF